DDPVADTRQVLHTAAAHEHDGVLLQVVADAGDVGRDLDPAAQLHTGDLAQRGVRLLRRSGVDTRAHTTTLRTPLQRRGLVLCDLVLSALADQLLDGGHRVSVFLVTYAGSVAVVAIDLLDFPFPPTPAPGRVALYPERWPTTECADLKAGRPGRRCHAAPDPRGGRYPDANWAHTCDPLAHGHEVQGYRRGPARS